MSDVATHAASIIAFYKALTDGEVDPQVAGVCTIDFNKALLARSTPPIEPDPNQRREEIRAAAERKHAEREAQLS